MTISNKCKSASRPYTSAKPKSISNKIQVVGPVDASFLDTLITSKDLIEKLSISRSTLFRWCRAEGAPHLKIGKKIYFQAALIVKWIREKGPSFKPVKKARVRRIKR